MITIKDFKVVRIRYYNKSLSFDPLYDHGESTSSNGGCKLSSLKTGWGRFWAMVFGDLNLSVLTEEHYKDIILSLTCDRYKLVDLSAEEFEALRLRVLDTLRSWKLNIADIVIYAI